MDEEGGCFLRLILFVAPFAIPSSFAWSFHIASLVIASLFVPSLVILTSGNPVKEAALPRATIWKHLDRTGRRTR
jgi:cytochrome c oxidase assembly factor CtaG